MLHARAKPPPVAAPPPKEKKKEKPKLEEFIEARDYLGAVTLLEFDRRLGEVSDEALPWLAYSYFHLGEYRKAADIYKELLQAPNADPKYHLFRACCYFFLAMYKEADADAQQGGDTLPLHNRLMFHLSHKNNDETKLMLYHQKLQDTIEDQLCLASIHYLRGHYQEAIDVYKKILMDRREFLALNVYIALCYYKLDYYDVSHEVLNVYLHSNPNSIIAVNLKACNHFRLYNGKAAETELKQLTDIGNCRFTFGEDLVKHNLVVFRNGENALQILPPLLDIIPEARLNLVIHYLKNGDVNEAYNLIKDLEPTTPQEFTLKAVVCAAYGQKFDSKELIKISQQYFQLVGASPSECDTIPGRQCMASCFFLLKQFEDVLIYLNSIKSYFYNDDDFNCNLAIAKAANKEYKDAEDAFLLVQNDSLKSDYCYLSWLAKTYIMNGKSRLAWELYLKMETSSESFSLLQLIANDCYKVGGFFYSAKAFDVLERLDPNPEYWEGKRGACVGVFQQVVLGQESREALREVVAMLRNTSNPQVEYIIRTIKKWCKENSVKL